MRALLLALTLAACATDPTLAPRDCTPGATSACVCPGASGVQTCTAEGQLSACVCADAGGLADVGAVGDSAASPDVASAPDRQELFDAQETSSMRDGAAEASAEDRPDASVGHDAPDAPICQLHGMGELPRRRCATSADCRGCAELVPGYDWCCGLAGYCENRPPGQCTGDAGIYTPDAPLVNCDRFDWGVRCRTHGDCQAVCEPAGVNRLMWCCHPNGVCNPTRAPICS